MTINNVNDLVGTEAILYPRFMIKYSTWRVPDLSNTIPITSISDFPGKTVFHLLDDLNNKTPEFLPINNPFLFLSSNRKYIKHIIRFTKSDTDIIPLPDKGIIVPVINWQKKVNEYTKTTNKLIRPIMPDGKDPVLNLTTQLFINYNFMFRIRTQGVLGTFKRINYILTGILNNVMKYKDYQNFIQIPLPTDIAIPLKRNDFDRSFLKIDRNTLRYPEFPHYIFFIYLMNFIHNTCKIGLFNEIPTNMWEKINFVIHNDTDCVIYNLKTLKELNSGLRSIDADDIVVGTNKVIFKIIDQLNKLILTSKEDEIETIKESIIEVSEDITESNSTSNKNIISKIIETEADDKHRTLTKLIEEERIKQGKELIINNDDLTERQKNKALENLEAYKNLNIGGEKVLDIVHKSDNAVDVLNIKALDGKVADASMLQSKIIKFDESYMRKTFKQDLIGVLTSFNHLGLFLTDLKEEDISDELNQMMAYTAKYTDLTGASHPAIKFNLPKVDHEGRCYLNGSYRMMKKQRVNVTISKTHPSRVSLTSSYNKCLVERSANKQFYPNFLELLNTAKAEIHFIDCSVKDLKLPYEYSAISNKIINFTLYNHFFTFDFHNRFNILKDKDTSEFKKLEKKYGVFCGYKGNSNSLFYMGMKCSLFEVDKTTGKLISRNTISGKVAELGNITNKNFYEFIQIKLLSKNIPLGFVLSYKYGLHYMLKYLNTDYQVYPKGTRFESNVDDVVLKFKDASLVIPRSPLLNSMIFAGLNVFNLSKYTIEQMNDPDTYFDMMSYKGNTNYLKGVDSFFDLFIGYIEYKILYQMGEPTNIKDLLIRCASLLTTSDAKEPSSSANYRIRGYEKFNHIIYNELARAYSTWMHKSLGHSSKFNIHPFVIQQRINEDGSFDKLDIVNPIHQIKAKTAYSHLGEGGRTADTFMISERKFTKDSLGILSETTVDNSSAAINGYLTMDPNILNTEGLTLPKNLDTIQPGELLSVTSLLFPALTQDDGKRNTFTNIQSSQFVPIKVNTPMCIRTGYEKVISHLSGEPFASVAKQDGKIEDINEELKIVKVKYKDGTIDNISYAKTFSNNSGNGFYVPQELELNNFKIGDKVTEGDVIVFNKDFFFNSKHDKQVDMKLGLPTLTAFMEIEGNLDDASVISKTLAEDLRMDVGQVVTIVVSKDTNIYDCVKVGDSVKSTEPLMTYDENPLSEDESDKYDDGFLDILNTINRIKPKAQYTGVIADIHAYYKTPVSEMNPSLAKHVREWISSKNKKNKYTDDMVKFPKSQPLKNDKIGNIFLTPETVVIRFTIQQTFNVGDGDKLFIASANKSIVSDIFQEPVITEDGREVHLLHSSKGVDGRIVNSPYLVGVTSQVMEKLQQDILDIYFKD